MLESRILATGADAASRVSPSRGSKPEKVPQVPRKLGEIVALKPRNITRTGRFLLAADPHFWLICRLNKQLPFTDCMRNVTEK